MHKVYPWGIGDVLTVRSPEVVLALFRVLNTTSFRQINSDHADLLLERIQDSGSAELAEEILAVDVNRMDSFQQPLYAKMLISLLQWSVASGQAEIASRAMVRGARLGSVVVKSEEQAQLLNSLLSSCAVCLEQQSLDGSITLGCPNGHYFHTACLREHLRRGGRDCPQCRDVCFLEDLKPMLNRALSTSEDASRLELAVEFCFSASRLAELVEMILVHEPHPRLGEISGFIFSKLEIPQLNKLFLRAVWKAAYEGMENLDFIDQLLRQPGVDVNAKSSVALLASLVGNTRPALTELLLISRGARLTQRRSRSTQDRDESFFFSANLPTCATSYGSEVVRHVLEREPEDAETFSLNIGILNAALRGDLEFLQFAVDREYQERSKIPESLRIRYNLPGRQWFSLGNGRVFPPKSVAFLRAQGVDAFTKEEKLEHLRSRSPTEWHIFVLRLNGEMLTQTASPSMTVEELLKTIHMQDECALWNPSLRPNLGLNRRRATLSDYGVQAGDLLYQVLSTRVPPELYDQMMRL